MGLFDSVKAALACDCPVCTRHDEAHQQVPRVVLGATVHVDAEMAPLLDALAAANVLTVGSCIDLADATARLWPEKLPELAAMRDHPGMHYGRVVADRLTFVRVVDGLSARPFLAAAQDHGAVVTRVPLLAQVAFPRHLLVTLPGLVDA
jgi:hypothetical protein